MSPVRHWTPEIGHATMLQAHRAWVKTQPQYVIPGVLEQADAGTVRVPHGVGLLEPALSSSHSPGAGSLSIDGDGRRSGRDTRVRRQEGA